MPQYKRKLSKGYRWYYKFTYKGKTYHSNAEYLTGQEAKKAESSRYDNLEFELEKIDDDLPLLSIINLRLDYLRTARSNKYYRESKFYLKKLYDNLSNVQVSEITRGDIKRILILLAQEKKDENVDNYSVNAMLRAIKAMFNYGIKYCNLNISNPCQGIEYFPISKKLKYIPTDEEINEVLLFCSQEQRQLIKFVRDTGCRISEALNLKQGDVFNGYVVLYTRKSKSSNLVPRKVKYDTSTITDKEAGERIFSTWSDTAYFAQITPPITHESIPPISF